MFPVTLETPRLILREFEESDFAAVHEYGSLLEVVRYEPWGPNTEEDTREFILRAMLAQAATPRTSFEFAVTLRDSGRLIGGCGIRPTYGDRYDKQDADFGYTLRRDEWGKGYGTEVARALVRFGFEKLERHRIWATCNVENLASARVLEKAGLQLEGVMRKRIQLRGVWSDSRLYAILESDPRPWETA